MLSPKDLVTKRPPEVLNMASRAFERPKTPIKLSSFLLKVLPLVVAASCALADVDVAMASAVPSELGGGGLKPIEGGRRTGMDV